MANRSPARFLAPIALLAAVVGVFLVVQASIVEPASSDRPAVTTTTPQERRAARPRRRVYVVKAGDNLTVIAERTGVPIERIQALNPDVDPQALQTGQRLKLR